MDANTILLNAYAEDAAVMTLRIADLEAGNRALRELVAAALDQLHSMTKTLDRTRTQLYRLTEQIRTRPRHMPEKASERAA